MELIGTKLGGKYLIEAELGRGGMGIVYRAQQTSLDRTVAIKVLAPNLIGDPDGMARFQREAKAIARLNHPGIVQVFDIEEEENLCYLVMEFVDGEGLDKQLQRGGLGVPRTLRVVADIADALHFAHEKGVVHRDVKPANVLMTKDGRPKVADFGLAYLLDSQGGMTKTGMLVGSPSYMSPEQVHGHKLDRRTDVYSLGVVLFRMVTGRVPFVAESSHAILFKQVQEEPPDPMEINPELSVEVRNVVLTALAKSKEDRFQSMAEMRAALLACLGERPIEEARPGAPAAPRAGEETRGGRTAATIGTVGGGRTLPTAMVSESARPRPEAVPVPPREAPPAQTPLTASKEHTRALSEASVPVAAPAPARPSPWLWAAPAAAVVLLSAFVAYRFAGSTRAVPTPVPTALPQPTAVPQPTVVAVPTAALATPPPAEPTAPPSKVHPTVPVVAKPTSEPVKVRRTPAIRIAQVIPTAPIPSGQKLSYCLRLVGPTYYAQGRIKDVPSGFSGESYVAPRPDAARIKILASLDPSSPAEGQDFVLKANLENGGDVDLQVDRVEESVPTGEESFIAVTSVRTPRRVEVGRTELIYLFRTSMVGASTYRKVLKLVDKKGDSWTREIQIRPCGN